MRLYHCSRITSGALTVECRALRPRFDKRDSGVQRRKKAEAQRRIRTAVNRSPVDRMELMLAALGWDAMHYVLTFSPDWLPETYGGVREALRCFCRAARSAYRKKQGRTTRTLRSVQIIEGLHEQYHIHFVCAASDLGYEDVAALWGYGMVLTAEYVLQDKSGYRGLAAYLCKERNDGNRIPLGKQQRTCSRALSALIGAPERWRDKDGTITPDAGALCFSTPTGAAETFDNGWGLYHKLTWLTPDGSRECRRALRRMGYTGGKHGKAKIKADQVPTVQHEG